MYNDLIPWCKIPNLEIQTNSRNPMAEHSRLITFAQLGDLLQDEWSKGNIGEEIHESLEEGFLPIRELREKLHWILEREGDQLRLTVED